MKVLYKIHIHLLRSASSNKLNESGIKQRKKGQKYEGLDQGDFKYFHFSTFSLFIICFRLISESK